MALGKTIIAEATMINASGIVTIYIIRATSIASSSVAGKIGGPVFSGGRTVKMCGWRQKAKWKHSSKRSILSTWKFVKRFGTIKKGLFVERNVKRPQLKRQDRLHDDVTCKSISKERERETKWERSRRWHITYNSDSSWRIELFSAVDLYDTILVHVLEDVRRVH